MALAAVVIGHCVCKRDFHPIDTANGVGDGCKVTLSTVQWFALLFLLNYLHVSENRNSWLSYIPRPHMGDATLR